MIGIVMFFAMVVVPIIIFWSEHRREIRHLTRNQPAEIEPPAPVGWECTEYSQRLLEEKLVEAGAMEAVDMTTCENRDCVLCRPTRNLRRALVEEKAIKVRQERRRAWHREQEENKKRSMIQTKNEHRANANLRAGFRNVLDGPSEEIIFNTYELLKETYELHGGCEPIIAKEYHSSIAPEEITVGQLLTDNVIKVGRRAVNIDGIAVVRPEQVPADAGTTYYRYYDPETLRDYLLVKWSWKEANEDFSHRQRVPLLDSFHS